MGDEAITFKENIWPICLGKQSISDIDSHIGDKTLAVVGYGPLRSDVKVLDNPKPLLRDLKVTGFKVRTCQNKYSGVSTDDSRYKTIEKSLPQKFQNPSIYCAGIEGRNAGTCSGDSGGPIQWYNQDSQQTFLRGVVHGSPVDCNGERFPSLFVNVAHYDILAWIYSEVFPETPVEKPIITSIECNGTNDVGSLDGKIQSENYPLLYPSNSNCSYKIQTPDDTKIRLVFVEVEIDDVKCENDFLEIVNENRNLNQRICGNELNGRYTKLAYESKVKNFSTDDIIINQNIVELRF